MGNGDALQIGGLVQADGPSGGPAGDGFEARTARLRLGGEIQTLTYVLQTDFTAPRVLLNYEAPTDALTDGTVTGRLQAAF